MKTSSYFKNVINEAYVKGSQKRYYMIDLYNGRAEELPLDEVADATEGLRRVRGDVRTWKGEEYIVVEV
jgi:hypothetical protein